MEETNRVRLHGMWASNYSKRVEMALKIKGIPYEYVEEDLRNKSPLLLQYNPVNKKVPVLVHHGKPVIESLFILEYIDETWKNTPRLLPEDPYQRAKARFWASFIQQQIFEAMGGVIMSDGEALEKARIEVLEKMKILEDGIKEFFAEDIGTSDGKKLGFMDILVNTAFSTYKAYEEVLGVKFVEPEKNPLIHKWVTSLNELPLVQELLPPHDKLVAILQGFRQNALTSSN